MFQSQFAIRHFAKTFILAGVLALLPQLRAADWITPVTGNLLGTVVDPAGAPQIGATVKLFNRYDRIVAKTLSTPEGRFAFAGLPPDFYSIQVSMETFVPAFRDKIMIRAGANSMLQINLATLFSSIQLNPAVSVGAMSNDWKWVLRSSPATRPITRLVADDGACPDSDDLDNSSSSNSGVMHPRLFSGTHMLVGIGGGDAGLVDNGSYGSDVGTEFALSTSLYGKDGLQVAGRLGQGSSEIAPSTFALGAIYTPSDRFGLGTPPEVALAISQVRMVPVAPGSPEDGLMLRTLSLSLYESSDPTEFLHLEYGVTGESVEFVSHVARVSPFARVTVDLERVGTLVLAYSDGARPDQLTQHAVAKNSEPDNLLDDGLAAPVNALARMPQISLHDDKLELQSTRNMEGGFSKTKGSVTLSFSGFYEDVSNGRVNVAGDVSQLADGNLLSDGVSKTSIFNIGNYRRDGYAASVDKKFSDFLSVQMAYGRMGAFTASDNLQPGINSKTDFLTSQNHNLASFGARCRIPKTGTRISARYGWSDPRALVPDHVFTSQNLTLATGLNIAVRQPLPSFFGLGGRLELMGDLRNMLAQGYLPLSAGDQRMLLVETPRALRGGLSITF